MTNALLIILMMTVASQFWLIATLFKELDFLNNRYANDIYRLDKEIEFTNQRIK